MFFRKRIRLFVFGSIALVGIAGALAVACSDDPTTTPGTDGGGGGPDGSTPGEDGSTNTDAGGDAPSDGGTDAPRDARTRDANGPGEAGAECVFNHDCQLALRCECAGFACSCTSGVRGTGRNGIDECDAGEQCVSSLCIEGPGDSGTSYCSDECVDQSDCTGKLPLCSTIAGLGRVCIRMP